ncbi:hypothetical protein M9H77_16998 [Catharanthus roseus]|uniref:Uncharacterized protein n=1 Tax=Catharanthus roseus TaxID=4058 RepID=A0ACC0B3B9_CATRO|nr:hypothetical protein M9H77_16998 [Catharanthus roseus]
MASSSFSRSEKIILQGNNNIIFEVDKAVAQQFVTIKHMIEESFASKGPILLPKVPSNILYAEVDISLDTIMDSEPQTHHNKGDITTNLYAFKQHPIAMASSSSLSALKVILKSIDGKKFEVDEAVAKQSMMIEHLIEDRSTRTGLVVIPNVFGNILAKIFEYYKRVVTQPPSGENDVELKVFVSELVNNDEQTLFGLLVTADYLDIKGLLFLTCEDVLYMIKRKIRRTSVGFSTSCWNFP